MSHLLSRKIVAAARIHILSTRSSSETSVEPLPSLYAGQPIPAMLTIKTSFHWGERKSPLNLHYRMRFDVEEMVKEWLMSGRKRGEFSATVCDFLTLTHPFFRLSSAKDGSTFSVPITLIALHHGKLALPKVAVTPLPQPGESTMGSMTILSTDTHQVHGAEKVLVLPRGGRTTFVVGMGGEMTAQ